MDFADTEAEAAFRARARAWLARNRPPEGEEVAAAKRWQGLKADAGFACITWPSAWGGPGGSLIEQIIFDEEEAKVSPPENIFMIGLGMCLPTTLHFGGQRAIDRFARSGLRGEEIWCQLFSEPEAGSDLAAVRMSARREANGDWCINGQKVWTSKAHIADFGLLLCRSNADAPRHRGLTMFWVDMRASGIAIAPIKRMNGAPGFSAVFFSGVRVPDSQRLGEIDAGWGVALHTLMNERHAVGHTTGAGWRDLYAFAAADSGGALLENAAFRARLAELCVLSEGLRHTRSPVRSALSRGVTPGPEGAIAKLLASRIMMETATFAIDSLDAFGVISDEALAPLHADSQNLFLTSPGARIAGGADEIVKTIIAERILGLPAEPKPG